MSLLRLPARWLTSADSALTHWATDPDAVAVPFAVAVAGHWSLVSLAWWFSSAGYWLQIPAPLVGTNGPIRLALGVVGIALAVGAVGRRLWRHRLRTTLHHWSARSAVPVSGRWRPCSGSR